MTDDEVEAVARELAKVGGASWYPGRTKGPILRAVSERYKDRARVAIATLERFRAAREAPAVPQNSPSERSSSESKLQVGMTVVYRPPGDQRAISCRIERIENYQAYLVPLPQPTVGWVSLESLQPQNTADTLSESRNRAE